MMKNIKETIKEIKNNFFGLGILFGLTLGFAFTGLIYDGLRLSHWIVFIGSTLLSLYYNGKVSKFWKELKEELKGE